jgi:hypothetical protein
MGDLMVMIAGVKFQGKCLSCRKDLQVLKWWLESSAAQLTGVQELSMRLQHSTCIPLWLHKLAILTPP